MGQAGWSTLNGWLLSQLLLDFPRLLSRRSLDYDIWWVAFLLHQYVAHPLVVCSLHVLMSTVLKLKAIVSHSIGMLGGCKLRPSAHPVPSGT